MQEMAGCDYFRTPVKFQGVDIYLFVGIKETAGPELTLPVLFLEVYPIRVIPYNTLYPAI